MKLPFDKALVLVLREMGRRIPRPGLLLHLESFNDGWLAKYKTDYKDSYGKTEHRVAYFKEVEIDAGVTELVGKFDMIA